MSELARLRQQEHLYDDDIARLLGTLTRIAKYCEGVVRTNRDHGGSDSSATVAQSVLNLRQEGMDPDRQVVRLITGEMRARGLAALHPFTGCACNPDDRDCHPMDERIVDAILTAALTDCMVEEKE